MYSIIIATAHSNLLSILGNIIASKCNRNLLHVAIKPNISTAKYLQRYRNVIETLWNISKPFISTSKHGLFSSFRA